MNSVKAIICNAESKECTYTKIDPSLHNLKKILNCKYIESLSLLSYPYTNIICDEEARIKNIDKKYFQLYDWVFVNDAIIIGSESGEFVDVRMQLDEVEANLIWLPESYKE